MNKDYQITTTCLIDFAIIGCMVKSFVLISLWQYVSERQTALKLELKVARKPIKLSKYLAPSV